MICGVRKFHKYLWGRHSKIYTDHKPLLGFLGEMKPLPQHSLFVCIDGLVLCKVTTIYRPDTSIANADAPSRLPLPETVEVSVREPVLNLLQHLEEGPATMIKEARRPIQFCHVCCSKRYTVGLRRMQLMN